MQKLKSTNLTEILLATTTCNLTTWREGAGQMKGKIRQSQQPLSQEDTLGNGDGLKEASGLGLSLASSDGPANATKECSLVQVAQEKAEGPKSTS